MSVHKLHGQDPEIALVREYAESLAGALYDAQRELEELRKEHEVRGQVLTYAVRRWLEAELQRDKALDWAQREQSHRLDIEGSDRLLRGIERMDVLQHGGDAA